MSINMLPTINAILNATSGILIVVGYLLIRRGRVAAHRAVMIAAVTTSAVFLASYLTYHFSSHLVTTFQGVGWARPFYFAILISHSILAAIVPPFVIYTLIKGLRGQFDKHKRIARLTVPIWLYVSVTGVIVYLMLYHLYPTRP